MNRSIEEITQLDDPTVVLGEIDQYSATQLIRALRHSWTLDPHKRVAYCLAEEPINLAAIDEFNELSERFWGIEHPHPI